MKRKGLSQKLRASFLAATMSGGFFLYHAPEGGAEVTSDPSAPTEEVIKTSEPDSSLISDPHIVAPAPPRKLVLELQDFLIDQGYDQVTLTGEVDIDTTLALHNLKEVLDITPVDNEVTEDTLASYKSKLAQYQRENIQISASTLDESRAGKEYARIVGISANYYIKELGVSPDLVQQIHRASERAHFDFTFLIKLADAESSLRCEQEASTSSAMGCFQFTERTWLAYLHLHGKKYGLEEVASQITAEAAEGYYNFTVSDPDQLSSILDLRQKPEIAALMAAEFARDNYKLLKRRYNGPIGRIEIKAAHVMGGHAAAKFLRIKDRYPGHAARDYFPKEAESNPGLFYNDDRPVSMKQLYDRFKTKMSGHNYFAVNPPQVKLALLKPKIKTL